MDNSSSNPYAQTITLMTPDEGPVPIGISDIDDWLNYGVRISINYGSQVGASLILLICLLLTTQPDKRTTAIFALNSLALFFNFIRGVCQCIHFTGQFYEFYNYFSGDFSTVPAGQYGASITAGAFTLLVLICVESSLALQVRCILNTPMVPAIHRQVVTIVSAVVALGAIAFRFALTVENCQAILKAEDFGYGIWLEKASTYAIMTSIIFFSAAFVSKLAVALRRRRSTLGMQQFGPMEIVFIMGCQTMIIPAIFAVLQNFTSVPELGAQTLTITAIFLPLSSLWAAASIETPRRGMNGGQLNHHAKKATVESRPLGSMFSRKKSSANDIESSNSSSQPPTIMTSPNLTIASSSSVVSSPDLYHKVSDDTVGS